MASAQCVLIFQGPDIYGWSERFWYAPGPGSATLLIDVADLVTARAAILTDNCKITRARVSSAVPRNPFIISLGGGAGVPGTEMHPTAESEVALLLLLQNTTLGYNRPFCRGIPTRIISGDSYNPDPAFIANLNAFTTTLRNGKWNVVGTLNTNPVFQYKIVTTLPQMPRGISITFTTPAGAPAPIQGQSIRIHKGVIPGFNGVKRIVDIPAAGTIVVGGAAPPVADTSSASFFTIQGSFDSPIQDYQALGITRRGAGRPFGLTRGRRQTLYSLRP